MKSVRKTSFVEKASKIGIDAKFINGNLLDQYTGFQLGSLKQVCQQFGVKISIKGAMAVLSAPRDRLQPMAERLHHCRIPFVVL